MGRCRSSAGCRDEGTHGTFGPTFCETHYIEIRAVCDAMKHEAEAKKTSNAAKRKPRRTLEQKFNALLTEAGADRE